MKAGMMTADAVTNCEPDICRGSCSTRRMPCGLESVVRLCEGKLRGVLNGIDVETIDPAHGEGNRRELRPGRSRGEGGLARRRCSVTRGWRYARTRRS